MLLSPFDPDLLMHDCTNLVTGVMCYAVLYRRVYVCYSVQYLGDCNCNLDAQI